MLKRVPKKAVYGLAFVALVLAAVPGYRLLYEGSPASLGETDQTGQAAVAAFATDGLLKDFSRPYGTNAKQTLDVVYRSGLKNAPMIVLVHGGGFVEGSSRDMLSFATFFANKGYVAASVNYRLASKTGDGANGFPIPVNDVACSVAWVKGNAARYGGNPQKVIIMGHSAGANLAAMVAFNPSQEYLAGCKTTGQTLATAAFIGSSGPYDFSLVRKERWEPGCYLQKFFGLSACSSTNASWKSIDKTKLKTASPITYVSAGDPVSLIITGDKDCYLHRPDWLNRCAANSAAMASALNRVGVKNQLSVIKGFEHGTFVQTFQTSTSSQKVIADFMAKLP